MKAGYVSLVGLPNSGKSTLLNKILGEKLAIVTRKAQTTRQKIVGIHNMPGVQIVFLDTPGMHKSEKPLNKYMMAVVDAAIEDADLVAYVIDISGSSGHPEPVEGWKTKNFVIILNKVDLVLDNPWQETVDQFKTKYEINDVVAVSAKTGFGVDELINKIAEKLPEGDPFYPEDIYTEHPLRFIVSEIVREQVLLNMHQEIPYSIAVEVEDYKEEENIHRIYASIVVEKESQKGMIIGAGGRMIKNIGRSARAKIESIVRTKVFLKLFVKVEKNWTKDPKAIKRLYSS